MGMEIYKVGVSAKQLETYLNMYSRYKIREKHTQMAGDTIYPENVSQ